MLRNAPQQTTNILIGTCRVWRGTADSGSTWSTANELSPAFDGTGGACTRKLRNGALARRRRPARKLQQRAELRLNRALRRNGRSARRRRQHRRSSLCHHRCKHRVLVHCMDGRRAQLRQQRPRERARLQPRRLRHLLHCRRPARRDRRHRLRHRHGLRHRARISIDPPTSARTGSTSAPIFHRRRPTPSSSIPTTPTRSTSRWTPASSSRRSVTTCSSTNCWSPLGTGLPNAPVTTLEAAPQMPTGDGRLGMLRAGTYGRGLWQIPLLNATSDSGAGHHALHHQPHASPRRRSPRRAARRSSPSPAPAISPSPSAHRPSAQSPADFVETDNCSGQTLAVGATCTFSISFAPTQTGTRSGTAHHLREHPRRTGDGLASAEPRTAPLRSCSRRSRSPSRRRSSIRPLPRRSSPSPTPARIRSTLNSPAITGDFTIAASTCGATLASQTACSLSISFTPTASGTRTGVLTVTDSAGTQTAQLTGTGNAPATDTLAPASLTFAQQAIGTTSAAQQVTLTNAGDVALTLITASVSPGDFTATNSCGASLNPHSTCAISVAFVPTAIGTRTATVTVTDQFRSQTVALTGTGVAPPGVSLSPASLSFPATGVGLSCARADAHAHQQRRPSAAHLANTALSAGFQIASSTCGSTLAPAASPAISSSSSRPPAPARSPERSRSPTTRPPAARRRTSPAPASTTRSRPTAQPASRSRAVQRPPIRCCSVRCRDFPAPSRSPARERLPTASAPSTPSTANLGGTYTISATVQTGQSQTAQPCEAARSPMPWSAASHGVLAFLHCCPLAARLMRRRRASHGCCCPSCRSQRSAALRAAALRAYPGNGDGWRRFLLTDTVRAPTPSPSAPQPQASRTASISRSSCSRPSRRVQATRPALTALAHAHWKL